MSLFPYQQVSISKSTSCPKILISGNYSKYYGDFDIMPIQCCLCLWSLQMTPTLFYPYLQKQLIKPVQSVYEHCLWYEYNDTNAILLCLSTPPMTPMLCHPLSTNTAYDTNTMTLMLFFSVHQHRQWLQCYVTPCPPTLLMIRIQWH